MTRQNIADILCIGCQKGSTSWLHSVLNTHPDTWAFPDSEPLTSTDKEAHFWDRNHARGEDWYRALMTPPDPALKSMDFTPEYAFLSDRQIADCKRLNPGARVIYILRDPMARAVSALRMRMLWRFGAGADVRLTRSLLDEMLPHAQIDEHGSFMRNLDAWKRQYPDVLVLNYEELHANRAAGMARIMAHVGLDPARLTGESRERFDAVMAGKVWESERFPVDRDVLVHLMGFTARTRAAVKGALGFDFAEGQRMIDAAAAPSGDLSPLLGALEAIRAELATTRDVAAQQRKLLEDLRNEVQGVRRLNRLILDRSVAAMDDEIEATISAVQMSFAQTLDAIHERRLSLARFGDGEFLLMVNPDHKLQFQRNSEGLRRELRDAMNPDWLAPGRVLVGLSPAFRGNLHWTSTWITTWPTIRTLIDPKRRYANSHVTRPVFFEKEGKAGVARWRKLWQGRPVLVVTGKGSRFDLIPELFDAAGKVDFLHAAPVHAFDDRAEILKGITERAGPDTLVLLSLGPTATVLAHMIAARGIQALDIGHLSASYNFVHANGALPEAMQAVRQT
jgi:hypothetical protein